MVSKCRLPQPSLSFTTKEGQKRLKAWLSISKILQLAATKTSCSNIRTIPLLNASAATHNLIESLNLLDLLTSAFVTITTHNRVLNALKLSFPFLYLSLCGMDLEVCASS